MKKNGNIEYGVYDIPLLLSQSLEHERPALHETLLEAQRRLRDFATRNSWRNLVEESFADRAEIYDNQKDFIRAIYRVTGMDDSTEIPNTTSAVLENRVLLSVSPRVYEQIYPEGIEDKAFEKLITHEMAHRLHIRILKGKEDDMGPIWFFEGFAIYAAGQFEDASLQNNEIWEALGNKERVGYKKYSAVFRYFLKKTSIQEMVCHAGSNDFPDWLRKIDGQRQ